MALASQQPLYLLDSSHGLGSNQIHALALDQQSRLWLATPMGLVCYDGSFTHHWDRRNGLTCNGLRSVAVDGLDRVWVGTDRGVELLDADGRVTQILGSADCNFGICEQIDAAGADVWIACGRGMVQLERHRHDPTYEVSFSADVGFVNDITRWRGGTVLAVSSAMGLVESDGRAWWRYKCAALAGVRATGIKAGILGELLLATDQGLLVVDHAAGRVSARLRVPGIDPTVSAFAIQGHTYWVAFGRTLAAFTAAAGGMSLAEVFNLESPANDLLGDKYGNVWIATDGSGLAKVSCLRKAIARIGLGKQGGVYSIKPGQDDSYLIGGDSLFARARLSEDATVALVSYDGLPETVVWDSLEENGVIWVSTHSGLFRTDERGRFFPCFPEHPVLGAPNRVLLKRGDDIWAGTLRGLARIRGDEVVTVEAAGQSLGYVYALSLDDRSTLWIGTLGRGLWRDDGVLTQVLGGPLTADGNVYAVAQGPEGRMVVLQDEIIVLLDGNQPPRRVAQLAPVAGWTFIWLDAQTIAVGGSDGVRLLDIKSGRFFHHVRSLLRLRDWEFTNNRTLVRDAGGRLLCGLTSGLARVDLDLLRHYQAPVCKLVDVTWSGVDPIVIEDRIVVPRGRWTFRLRGFSAWLVDSEQIGYQHQLVGFDDDWSPPRATLEVVYNSLPPGKYVLKARASSPLTGLGPESELLRFEVRSPARNSGGSALASGIRRFFEFASLIRSGNQHKLRAHARLEREVSERTQSLRSANMELQQMRDEFKRLSEIDELTQLGNRRNLEKELVRANALARRLNAPLALLMIDIDYFKSVNDHLGHPTGDEYLRNIARALSASVRVGVDIATRYGGEEFAVLLLSTDGSAAVASAERLRAAVADLALPNPGAPAGMVSISIGIAVAQPDDATSGKNLLLRADQALYRAKSEGRDRLVLADDSPVSG